ncbi:hypothetical protein [Pseudovibrio denitrificans]|nr:hypothetical protein [Pseudovibrio denitrificans]
MSRLKRFFPFWFVTLLITLILCAVVWIYGPSLSIFGAKHLQWLWCVCWS